MRKPGKSIKIITITLAVVIALLIGTVALASAYPDHPILQFFVIENPFSIPEQDIFPMIQIFEDNRLTLNRIDNIQFSVLPDGGVITTMNKEQIRTVWELLSEVEITTVDEAQARINEESSIFIDIQFLNPNHNAGIEISGQLYILGRGPFAFEDSSSKQRFIDVFTSFANTIPEYVPPDPENSDDYFTSLVPADPEDNFGSDILTDPPIAPTAMNLSMFLELLEARGFVYEDIEEATNIESFLSVGAKRIIIEEEFLTVYLYNSRDEMETDAGYIDPEGFSINRPDSDIEISWASAPHWFKCDLIIVLYVGLNEEMINFLIETLGYPFAGQLIS